VYSARVNGEPTTFGTSGLLYRSNKLMYDRATDTLWHQFTGEPVIGALAGSGIKLVFLPSVLTTWEEWLAEHPDTTVISAETGLYPQAFYEPESDPAAIYYAYRASSDTMFPVWSRSNALATKDVVLGIEIGDASKAYPIGALQQALVVNDEVGGTTIVVIGSRSSQSGRAYESGGRMFTVAPGNTSTGTPTLLADQSGDTWSVTEEFLIHQRDGSGLPRVSTRTSFWFGWFSFHPDTEVFTAATPGG
jgi:hypothetical protein